MQRAFLVSISRAAVAAGLLTVTPAFAHIDLIEPEARAHGTGGGADTDVDTNSNQKTSPCGEAVAMGRGDRVATFAPGSTITIRVREEIDHESYIRVLLDLDGQDFLQRPTMQTSPETEQVARAAEEALGNDYLLAVVREANTQDDFVHEISVTLPDETCDNCTLQVVQFMYGAPNPFYFQCADIVISDGADAGAGGAGSNGGGVGGTMMAVQSGGTSGIISAGGSSMAMGGAAGAASTGSAGSSSVDGEDEPADDEGGCAISTRKGGSAATGLLSLLALALGLARRRR